jgi:hypothetical protein
MAVTMQAWKRTKAPTKLVRHLQFLASAILLLSVCLVTAACRETGVKAHAKESSPVNQDWKGYPDAPAKHYPKASRFYVPKAYDDAIDERSIAILCDPVNFKFSIHASADKTSLNRGYPERWLIKKDNLTEYYPEFTGEKLVREFLRKVETCGPYRLRFEGDALNGYAGGEMGAEDTFANVTVAADRNWILPVRQLSSGESAIRLFHCAIGGGRQSDCPDSFATQIDGEYDAKLDEVWVREFLTLYEPSAGPSGEVIKRPIQKTRAGLNLYWISR